jgi:hypothetical protein
MQIPERVKIHGQYVRVDASGRGYVKVGNSTAELSHKQKEDFRKQSYDESQAEWQKEMYELFKIALKAERAQRQRLKL